MIEYGQDIFADAQFYIALLMGLCLGSFATAIAHRLPRGISMVAQERSQCPRCGRDLRVAELVPVLSWILLLGRCRGCRAFYGWKYIAIEIGTLALCLGFYFLLPEGAPLLAFHFAACIMMAMTVIDYEWQILPDWLNAALAATAGLAIVMMTGLLPFSQQPADWAMAGELALAALIGAFIYGIFAYLLRVSMHRLLRREALGLGDVKFFIVAGLWLGGDLFRMGCFLIVAGTVGTLLGVVWRRRGLGDEIPFGPALIVALAGFLLAGWCLPADAAVSMEKVFNPFLRSAF